MQLNNYITVKQTQQLNLTPELKQSIKILQLNQIELNEYINEELLNNPLLQSSEAPSNDVSISDIVNTTSEIYNDNYDISANDHSKNSNDYNYMILSQNLTDTLLNQLGLFLIPEKDKEICRFIIGNINDNGYLDIDSKDVISKYSISIKKANDLIKKVQTLEPIGVGARNIKECLQIQLNYMNLEGSLAYKIVSSFLDDLASNRLKKIAKELDEPIGKIKTAKEIIINLDPKPGSKFNDSPAQYIIPDIVVTKDDITKDYHVNLNENTPIPRLMINSQYVKMLELDPSNQVSDYISQKIQTAQNIMKNIEQRNNTIRKVTTAIINHQYNFFEKGSSHLKTLTLKDIADKLGIHESTVQRATTGKYMQCHRGIFELKYFFQSGVQSISGDSASSESIKKIIKDMIDSEDTEKPYSDQYISNQLNNSGIIISRRTVAKYRDALNILSSSKRKTF